MPVQWHQREACEHCGRPFQALHADTRFCSVRCNRNKEYAARAAGAKIVRWLREYRPDMLRAIENEMGER